VVRPALARAAGCIEAELSGAGSPAPGTGPAIAGQPFQPRPDPLMILDLTPWLLRRLDLACAMARELRLTQARVLAKSLEPAAIDNAGLAPAPAASSHPTHE